MVNWPSDSDLIDAAADIFLQNEKFFSYIITTNGHTPYTNWPSDSDLIDAAADIFLQNEKFFSYIITTNGHTPYTTQRTELAHNYEYVRPFVAEHADEEIVYYYAAQNAFDESMARLIERLDEAGKLEETVIVIFGDHYPYPIHHEKIWGYDPTDEYNWQELAKVPLIVWTPNMEAKTISKLSSTFDVAPTSFVAEHADEEIVYYYAAQNAFDESMARLIERLDEAGKLEETVIVIFGDHYPYPIHHEKIWGYDPTDEYNWQELAKVPLIVWTPNMEAKTISKLSSTFDVAPTLANLFNLSNYDYYHTFGIDIFSADEAIVTFDNYGWITEHARNNVWSEYTESYDEIGTEAYINEMNNYVLERFQIGQEILKDNYFLEK